MHNHIQKIFLLLDVFSSQTSSSFSPSLSDGITTPHSLTQDNENQTATDNGSANKVENHQSTGNGNIKSIANEGRVLSNRSSKMKIGSDGSYHCQFCDKTFPRLGYLKKHEQVCVHSILLFAYKFNVYINLKHISDHSKKIF